MLRPAVLICFLIAFSACDNTLKKVHVGTTPFFGEAAFYVAEEQGFFKNHGLNVISHPHSAGKKSLEKLYSGKLDIAHTAELPVVYAINGAPEYKGEITPLICANMIYNSEMQKVIARKDKGIESPADLVNKRIGYFKGTTSEFFLNNFLLEHNIADTAIEEHDIDVTDQLKAIKNNKVDAVASWEPYASKILSEMDTNAIKLDTKIDHSTLWLVVSTDEYISEHPEVITSYLEALKQAQAWIRNHPDQTQRLLAQKTNSSKQLMAKLWDEIDYELSLRERMVLLLEDQQRWLQQKGYVDSSVKRTDFEDMIYFKAMEDVYPQGITIIK